MSRPTSLIIATYNKEYALPNTLAAISRQIWDDLEIIVIDDFSKNDPAPIVNHILGSFQIPYKYKRLPRRVGGRVARGYGLDYVNPSSEVIITLAADVMPLTEGLLRDLSDAAGENTIALCEVKNIPVPNNVFEHIDFYIERTLESWDMYPRGRRILQGKDRPDGMTFLFCAAALKKDLEKLNYRNLSCDYFLFNKMIQEKMQFVFYENLKAIHQIHSFVQHPCSEIGICVYSDSCIARGVQKL